MAKPITAIALGGGISLAAIGFVAAFLWVESPPEDDLITPVVTLSADLDDKQPRPTEVALEDLETTESGLQYFDIEVGTGETPVDGQMVKVAYSGWLQDGGKMFDSSVHNGRPPIEFQLGRPGIIQGWQEGVATMKVGGKRQLVIPPDLAYGEKGRPPIPPKSTLVFDVELVELGAIRQRPDQPQVDMATATELDQGIKIVDIEPGDGPEAGERSVIEMELTIWNEEGALFFSSMDRPSANSFLIGGSRVERPPLEGLDVGVRGMRTGGVRYLELPAPTAFGERGQPPVIAPNSTIYALVSALSVTAPRVAPESPPAFDRAAMTTTESGLMYLDLEPGEGESPKAGQMVFAEYSGWLENGTLFDSSYKRKDAFSFPLGRGAVIKAWDEAIATMKPGGKRIIVAPPEIAYGDSDKGTIPPNSTLIFQIELKEARDR